MTKHTENMSTLEKIFRILWVGTGTGFFVLVGTLMILFGFSPPEKKSTNENLFHKTVKIDIANPIDPENDGNPIYFTGNVTTSTKSLKDPEYGVEVQGALRLKRVVEMCQWKEKKVKIAARGLSGDKFKYLYNTVWATSPIHSDRFKERDHVNPKTMSRTSRVFDGENITIGKYPLLKIQLEEFTNWGSLPISLVKSIPDGGRIKGNYVYFPGHKVSGDTIGDLRVSFLVQRPCQVTCFGTQDGNRLKRYDAERFEEYRKDTYLFPGKIPLEKLLGVKTGKTKPQKSPGLIISGLAFLAIGMYIFWA